MFNNVLIGCELDHSKLLFKKNASGNFPGRLLLSSNANNVHRITGNYVMFTVLPALLYAPNYCF